MWENQIWRRNRKTSRSISGAKSIDPFLARRAGDAFLRAANRAWGMMYVRFGSAADVDVRELKKSA